MGLTGFTVGVGGTDGLVLLAVPRLPPAIVLQTIKI